jgi:hypothetical protein
MYCPSCGQKNPDDARFCANCGKPLPNMQANPQSEAQPVQPAEPVETPVQPSYTTGNYTQPQPNLMQQPRPTYSPTMQPRQSSGLAGLWIGLGIAAALISILFVPPLFGGLGIFFGYLARKNGSQTGGVVIMIVAGICLVFGMILGAAVASM